MRGSRGRSYRPGVPLIGPPAASRTSAASCRVREPTRPRRSPLRGLPIALLLAFPGGSCGEPLRSDAWIRTDLTTLEPTARRAPASAETVLPVLAFAGPQDVRDLARLSVAKRQEPPLRAPRVHGLRQAGGSRVTWRVRPGAAAYLAFTPLASEPPCAVRWRVEARADDKTVVLSEGASPQQLLPAAGEIAVDLARWRGRAVEISFALADGACGMTWGSPAIYWRGAAPEHTRPAKRPSIVLLGIDTLRADALGAYGRRPSLTPAIDALAKESDVWLDAFTVVNSTNPSFASLMTGLYPKHHGVHNLSTPLPAVHVTLAERLSAAGWETHAILAAQHLGPRSSGLDQGFDELVPAVNTSTAQHVVDQAIDWLQGDREKPFFLWLHLFDPHTPHTPPEPFALGRRTALPYGLSPVRDWTPFRALGPRRFVQPALGGARDLYDGEVAYVDRQVDRLLDFLSSRGMLEDTLVVLVADHGENLEDHGVAYRHAGLWDTTTHIPLMIRWPGEKRDGGRLRGLVQTIDLYPTLLRAAGLRPNAQDGRDLATLTGSGRGGRPAVFSEQADGTGASVRTRSWRYFASSGSHVVPAGPYLYDLTKDPAEATNLTGQRPSDETRLRELLQRWLRSKGPRASSRELTPEEAAELRALGYL